MATAASRGQPKGFTSGFLLTKSQEGPKKAPASPTESNTKSNQKKKQGNGSKTALEANSKSPAGAFGFSAGFLNASPKKTKKKVSKTVNDKYNAANVAERSISVTSAHRRLASQNSKRGKAKGGFSKGFLLSSKKEKPETKPKDELNFKSLAEAPSSDLLDLEETKPNSDLASCPFVVELPQSYKQGKGGDSDPTSQINSSDSLNEVSGGILIQDVSNESVLTEIGDAPKIQEVESRPLIQGIDLESNQDRSSNNKVAVESISKEMPPQTSMKIPPSRIETLRNFDNLKWEVSLLLNKKSKSHSPQGVDVVVDRFISQYNSEAALGWIWAQIFQIMSSTSSSEIAVETVRKIGKHIICSESKWKSVLKYLAITSSTGNGSAAGKQSRITAMHALEILEESVVQVADDLELLIAWSIAFIPHLVELVLSAPMGDQSIRDASSTQRISMYRRTVLAQKACDLSILIASSTCVCYRRNHEKGNHRNGIKFTVVVAPRLQQIVEILLQWHRDKAKKKELKNRQKQAKVASMIATLRDWENILASFYPIDKVTEQSADRLINEIAMIRKSDS